MRRTSSSVLLAALPLLLALPAGAQVADHLTCYKVRDPLKLRGVVDLDVPQFGGVSGCAISSAKLFCVPASKTVVSAEDRTGGGAITPLSFWAPPEPGDRICYKVKCPEPVPADQEVTDQFGTRTLARFKSALFCTPAVKGATATVDGFRGLPGTDQVGCWNGSGVPIACAGTGYDGDVQAGAPLAYVDNGDGTVTDLNTGLMWEKKSDDGSIHDKDATYTLDDALTVHVGGLNAASFAGHDDWRVPNVRELQSIVDFHTTNPAVSAAFNTACTAGCDVTTCSCTTATFYWSSTAYMNSPGNKWQVDFVGGYVNNGGNINLHSVRAVRGGR